MPLLTFARRSLLLLLVTTTLACAGGSSGGGAAPASQKAAAPTVTSTASGAPGDAGPPAAPDDAVTATHNGHPIELACNGKDDDGDGQVDMLLPAGPNLCKTGLKGACATGTAICDGGKRTCIAPSPMPEVADGIDNDCNGVVDDVAAVTVRPRATLLVPRYAWTDAAPDIANVATSLGQAGISFDRPKTGSHWEALATLDDYALAILPGYVLGSVLPPIKDKLLAFVERGGVLVVFKPIGEQNHPEALALAGLRSGTRHRDVEEIRIDGPASPATSFADSADERSLGINRKGDKAGVEVWTFDVDPDAKTEVLGTAMTGGGPVGAAMTRRRLGKGSVYAFGHDLASFGSPHCYTNCFESAGDAMRLVFEGAMREGARGHVALLSTAPSLADSVLVLTHDVYSHESLYAGGWGEPGAMQFAKVEKERGVHATFHVMTDYRAGHFNAKTARDLCDEGMCPLGVDGVSRVPQFARMADGMVRDTPESPWRCKETLPTYNVPSLCGEVFLSSQLVRSATNRAPRSWRSPSLAYHAELTQVLAGGGIQFDSSFGIGDIPFNVPLDMATTGIQQRRFHRRPILEFPLSCDDGIDVIGPKSRERIELGPETEGRFRGAWEYVITQNARNHSFTTLRVNAARGESMPPGNLAAKAQILGRFLDELARDHREVVVRSVEEAGDFWRARLEAKLEARYDAASGYAGSLTIGKTTAPGMTIELGDAIAGFECDKCGETKIAGNRVTVVRALPPGTKADFVAKLR